MFYLFQHAFPFGSSGFLLQTKDMLVRLIGCSKLSIGVNVRMGMLVCLYVSALC